MFSKIKEKILNLSDKYLFYKNNYEKLLVTTSDQEKMLNDLKEENKELKTLYNDILSGQSDFNNYLSKIESLTNTQASQFNTILEKHEDYDGNISKLIKSTDDIISNQKNFNLNLMDLTYDDELENDSENHVSSDDLNDFVEEIKDMNKKQLNQINVMLSLQKSYLDQLIKNTDSIMLNQNKVDIPPKVEIVEEKESKADVLLELQEKYLHQLINNTTDIMEYQQSNSSELKASFNTVISNQENNANLIKALEENMEAINEASMRIEKSTVHSNIKIDSKFNENQRFMEKNLKSLVESIKADDDTLVNEDNINLSKKFSEEVNVKLNYNSND